MKNSGKQSNKTGTPAASVAVRRGAAASSTQRRASASDPSASAVPSADLAASRTAGRTASAGQLTVDVGLMTADSIEFEIVGGPCGTARYSNGRVEWEGRLYDRLTFDGNPCPALSARASFRLKNVCIGIDFHWQQRRNLSYCGVLSIVPEDGRITAVNTLGIENYLLSVISSEMKASAGLSLLKAHAVISRSWLMARILDFRSGNNPPHRNYVVCSDDHCQRYQGRGMAKGPNVLRAIRETRGQVLSFDGRICDARYSKCCGGTMELFSSCWEDTDPPYLQPRPDTPRSAGMPNALVGMPAALIAGVPSGTPSGTPPALIAGVSSGTPSGMPLSVPPAGVSSGTPSGTPAATPLTGASSSAPPVAPPAATPLTGASSSAPLVAPPAAPWFNDRPFCDCHDRRVLAQVLNDYDLRTEDFFEWTERAGRSEFARRLKARTGIDFGQIVALEPLRRGPSGRIIELRVRGTLRSEVLGKELAIRRALSDSHLKSSAFEVEYDGDDIILRGRGWGHGVGLCQIGAAVMASRGYDYRQILAHYYPGSIVCCL